MRLLRKPKKNPGGRRLPIDNDTLWDNRDQWIGLLSHAWGDIGWPLRNAITPERVRRALASIETTASREQALLEPFLRPCTTQSTPSEIRSTRRKLEAARKRENDLVYRGYELREQSLNERMRESKEALKTARRAQVDELERVRGEHLRRVKEWVAFRGKLKERRDERSALESTLKEQEPLYALYELTEFIRAKRHAHSPLTLARAMAGLPYIGAWQSYRRCAGRPETLLWPTFPIRIFEIVAKAWKDRRDRSSESFLNRIAKRVRAIPTAVERKKEIDHHAAALQRHFSVNWRYMKQAVEATDLTGAHPESVPYLVLGDFVKRVANATSTTERVLAATERLDLALSMRPKGKSR